MHLLIALLLAASTDSKARIDKDVREVLRRTQTPGATLLVIRDGKTLVSQAYGFRELAGRLPARMDTPFEIGSITKQLTAAAVLQLRDAGKLDLDAKVSAYLPAVPHAGEVTPRQLLTHTSGLPDFISHSTDERVTSPATFDQLMAIVAGKPLDFPPGSHASYSNTGYIILGRLIELASHETYRQYIRAHLLTPAGMTRTFNVADEPSLPAMAKGYRHVDGKLQRGLTIHDSVGWSAGNLVMAAGELEKWNEALTGGKIVPPADYASMTTPQQLSDGSNSGYGFGLAIDSIDGQPRIGHTGGSYGFTAANFYFTAQKLRIIVLTNNADNPEPGEMVANAVFEDLYPDLSSASAKAAAGEDRPVTERAKRVFEFLQKGKGDISLFGPSLTAKMNAGLRGRMSKELGPYGAPEAFIFKGRRLDQGKAWFDYLIRFGPGSMLKFSAALDADAKIVSFGFNTF